MRTSSLIIAFLLLGLLATRSSADAVSDVSEIGTYKLIYQLSPPTNAAFNSNPVPYGVDNSALSLGPLSRIGYYLELDDGTGRDWVWVSMDAFTSDLAKIGVPTLGSSAIWQMTVANMNVESNVAGIVTGTDIATGNVEFWPGNYDQAQGLGGLGGSSLVYDFDDSQIGTGNYGSMQVHNHAAGQTLLAYNNWGASANFPIDDLGVGNNTLGNPRDGDVHPDWTFSANVADYSLKNLEVWVSVPFEVPSLPGAGLALLAMGLLAIARHKLPTRIVPHPDGNPSAQHGRRRQWRRALRPHETSGNGQGLRPYRISPTFRIIEL